MDTPCIVYRGHHGTFGTPCTMGHLEMLGKQVGVGAEEGTCPAGWGVRPPPTTHPPNSGASLEVGWKKMLKSADYICRENASSEQAAAKSCFEKKVIPVLAQLK